MDGRASLMDAIRNAGGAGKAKLRSAAERKKESKKKKQEQSTNIDSGGDLMSDLADKLRLRRKGMTGDRSGKESKNILEKMAVKIPLPSSDFVAGQHSPDSKDWEVWEFGHVTRIWRDFCTELSTRLNHIS